MFGEFHWHASAVGLLKRKDKLAVTVPEILMDDFNLAVELDGFTLSRLQLSRYRRVVSKIAVLSAVREKECAAQKHKASESRTAEDPRGTDLYFHDGCLPSHHDLRLG